MNTTPLRRACRLPGLAALLVAAGWLAAGSAGAAGITSFTMSPGSGPPGTVVTVSGVGCSSTLSVPSNDYVALEAPTFRISTRLPVAPNGSWHGSFTVPSNASSGSGNLVAPLCVAGLSLFTTVYTPQTFTVTAPPTTTTPTTTTPGSTNPSTTTTKPPGPGGGTTPPMEGGNPKPDGGGGSTSTVPFVGGFPSGTSGGGAGAGPNRVGATTAGPSSTETDVTRAARTARAARAADLSVPEFPTAHVSGTGGLGWLSWLLLVALVVAAFAAPLWLRRSRERPDDPAGLGDAG